MNKRIVIVIACIAGLIAVLCIAGWKAWDTLTTNNAADLTASIDVRDGDYPLKGVRLPAYDETGKLIREVTADGMSSPANDPLVATNIVITTFDGEQNVDAVITIDEGEYNKTTGKAQSDSAVKLERENVTITGTGLNLDPDTKEVVIHTNVTVVIDGGKGITLPKTQP